MRHSNPFFAYMYINHLTKMNTDDKMHSFLSMVSATITDGYDNIVLSLIKSTIAHVYLKLGRDADPKLVYDEMFKYPYLKENAEDIGVDYPFEKLADTIANFPNAPESSVYFRRYGGGFVDISEDKPSTTYH